MKHLSTIVVLCFICAGAGLGADMGQWETVSYQDWGLTLQIPAGAVKHPVPNQPPNGFYDVYSANGCACVIAVTPVRNLPTPTTIEKLIQEELAKSARLGAARRWEQDSRQGDLFKGFMGLVKIKGAVFLPDAVRQIVAGDTAFHCVSMAALGDDSSPVLSVGVFGPRHRENDITIIAKGMAAFVKKSGSVNKSVGASAGAGESASWPTLKPGQIELEGVISMVTGDQKSLILAVEFITMPGSNPIALNPARRKVVLLRQKMDWPAVGQRIRLLGTNTGVGKPMTADLLEKLPDEPPVQPVKSEPKTSA
ncbi:MAG: hypothetical protein ACOX3G_04650 [Armatimonadota bacterium]|jgi:hypothetical protein